MTDVALDLDDSLIQRLETKAELKGRTLEEEIRELVRRAPPLTPEERAALPDRGDR